MSMIEALHPGVYVIEKMGQPLVQGVGVSTGSIVGRCKKGPLNKPGLATSFEQFERLYGGFYLQYTAPIAAWQFFENGGTRLFVARSAKTAVTATKDMLAFDDSSTTTTISALNEGAWGNDLSLTTAKVSTTTTTELITGSSELTLTSVQNLELGDRLIVTDGTSTEIVTLLSIDLSTSTVTFKPLGTITTIALGATALTSSTHRTSTTLVEDLADAATTAKVTQLGSIRVGSIVTFASADDEIDVVVTAVSGSTNAVITFSAITLSSTIVATSIVVSQEFNLQVLDGGINAEPIHKFLSVEATNEADFLENRLAGDGNQSVFIEAALGTPAGTPVGYKNPYPVVGTFLASGSDGVTLDDASYIGVTTPGLETGLQLFNRVDEINMVAIPGITSVWVLTQLVTWCENRHAQANPVVAILDAPYSDDTPLEVQEFKQLELNRDTSHAALYYPWIKVPYPPVSGLILDIPPSGAVMGVWARVAINRGVFKAPANEELRSVVGLTYNVTDGEQDILNPIGINVIRSFKGRGIRIWGARTMTSLIDGRHYVHKRRTLNFIEESVAEAIQWSVFEPHNADLWDQVRLQIAVFLNRMWRGGALQPRDDRSKAYFVKVDATNNPQSEIDAGRFNIEVGVNVVGVAEFVIFTVGLWDGGRLLEELV